MSRMKQLLSGFIALILSGCTQVGVGVANLPAKFGDTEIVKDISYGDEPWQKLDIYIPEKAKTEKLPVVVFFYGGRWTDGSKDMYAFVGDAFAKSEYVTVIADYSKYPNVKFPTFVEDGAKAIAWTYENIETYGGNKNALHVSGHSSGAHIGALVTADERYLKAEGQNISIIKAFAGLAGPYDFVPDEPDLEDMFGPPSNYPQMVVTTFIDGGEPPMLLLWGAKDTAVWRRNIDLLEAEIKKKNGSVETIIYPEVDHVGIVASLTWFLRGKAPVLKDVTNFFEKY